MISRQSPVYQYPEGVFDGNGWAFSIVFFAVFGAFRGKIPIAAADMVQAHVPIARSNGSYQAGLWQGRQRNAERACARDGSHEPVIRL
jgi:hypothetical protein